ncbi:phytoene desaturase family protein [Amnibacterium flavum]|uniref:phytoene desaturase family protein n=1 Tax=Amnibacterium flavum TaxID=2173173 RepID=UPI001401C29B|nr:phytoene desaturase family protein [Amnibacterium flavum]
MKRAAIIGGGISGLATAALLAREGYEVDLFEARDEVGGRAGSWESQGFRFDTGPSWYLMPEVFEHFYRLLGTSAEEQLDLRLLDPGYAVVYEPTAPGAVGERIEIAADRESNVALFESLDPGAGTALESYLDSAGETYELAKERFLYSTFADLRPVFSREVVRRTGRLVRLLLEPLDRFVRSSFGDERIRRLLGYPAVFLGGSPFTVPSMYHLMSHLDLDDGVLYPQGGMYTIIESLERLAEDAGVRIHRGTPVTKIVTKPIGGGKPSVIGIRYRGRDGVEVVHAAGTVVATNDLHAAETGLLPEKLQSYPQRWWDRRQAGPGAVLVYLGVRGSLPELPHHTLFFVDDWKGNFDSIFGPNASIPDPASIYVCKPSATDPSVAPAGHENVFILVPVPPDPGIGRGGVGGAGSDLVERAADAAIAQVAAWAGIPDLAERVVVRRTLGPGDLEADLGAWMGSALGPAHTLRQSAFFRAKNVSSRLTGLYYAGGSTIPGIGLPMCLISAELVLKRVRGDVSAGPLPEPARA